MNWRRKIAVYGLALVSLIALWGCAFTSSERIKLRDLDFTILSEDKIPEELKTLIEEKKQGEFQFTYTDKEFLYICVGYGEQKTGGYSIVVDDLYLTDNSIYAGVSLLGPENVAAQQEKASYPYIVIKTEYLEETVIFE